ncbi:beaten path IIIb [Musca autumnalis]|uniref:beaten path IIIb n=1 Tax=Musca autumnalis TaxID=221902 RepID=UPI003CF5035C
MKMVNSKERTGFGSKRNTTNITTAISNNSSGKNLRESWNSFNGKPQRANSAKSCPPQKQKHETRNGGNTNRSVPGYRQSSDIISFITNSITTKSTTTTATPATAISTTISNSSALGTSESTMPSSLASSSSLPSSSVDDFRVNSATTSSTKVPTTTNTSITHNTHTIYATTTTPDSLLATTATATTTNIDTATNNATETLTASAISRMTFSTSAPSSSVSSSSSSLLSSSVSARATTATISSSTATCGGIRQNFVPTISLKCYFFLWHFFCILAPCLSLSMTEVRIPKHIMRYEDATLGCKYDLDGESLYSVKWYKDGFEFYRYVPRDMPPGQVFPLPGVDVDLQNSTDDVVVLRRVTLQSTGRYRCEVSGEAPSFQTVSGHEDMIVVVIPAAGPQITGGKPRYQIGDLVSVNCTSSPSKPICHLSWLINGNHANRSFLRYYEPKVVGREGLEVATLGLEFRVRG